MSWDQPVYSFDYGQPPTPTRTPTSATFESNIFDTAKAESSFYDPRVTWNTADPHATSPNLLKTPKPFAIATPLVRQSLSSPVSDTPFPSQDLEAQIASHVHVPTTPNLPLPPVEPLRKLSASPIPRSNKRRCSNSEEEADTRKTGLALDISSAARSASSMRTPPPTSTSATRRKAQQAQVTKLIQQSATSGRRMSTPQFSRKHNAPSSTVQVETSPQQFPDLQLSPDIFDFNVVGPATAPILPQHKLFWDSKDDGGMSIDFSEDLINPFDRPNRPALDPFVSAHHALAAPNGTTTSFSMGFPKDDLMQTSMTTVTASFNQENHVSTSGANDSKLFDNTRQLARGVDPSLLFSSPGRSLNSGDGSARSSTMVDQESLQPYAYQMQEARRELASGAITKPKKKRKPDVDSPAVKAALRSLREGEADQAQLQQDSIDTRPNTGRTSPVKGSHNSISRPCSSRDRKHRTSIALTIDASGRARTETRTFVEDNSGPVNDPMDLGSDAENSGSDTSSDSVRTVVITSQPPSFQLPTEQKKQPKLGRFVTNRSNHSQKSSYTSVYTASSYAESSQTSNSNNARTTSNLPFTSQVQAQPGLPPLLPLPTMSVIHDRLDGGEDQGSEGETIMESDENDGNAQHELRKVMQTRARSKSANQSKQSRSRPGSRENGSSIYHNPYQTQNTSPSTITDPDLATPSSTSSRRELDGFRCVCHTTSREGQTIQCESCKKFLHVKCVGLNIQRLPKIYLCVFCTGQTPVVRGGRVRDGATTGFAASGSPLAGKGGRHR